MSETYTPSRIEVQCRYQEWAGGNSSDTEREAEFDRWLASVKARAWDEGYGDDAECSTPRTNPYRD